MEEESKYLRKKFRRVAIAVRRDEFSAEEWEHLSALLIYQKNQLDVKTDVKALCEAIRRAINGDISLFYPQNFDKEEVLENVRKFEE